MVLLYLCKIVGKHSNFFPGESKCLFQHFLSEYLGTYDNMYRKLVGNRDLIFAAGSYKIKMLEREETLESGT